MQNYMLNTSFIKNYFVVRVLYYSVIRQMIKLKTTNINNLVNSKIENIKDKLIYSDYIENKKLNFGAKNNLKITSKLKYKFRQEKNSFESLNPAKSIALKYLTNNNSSSVSKLQIYDLDCYEDKNELSINVPHSYSISNKYELLFSNLLNKNSMPNLYNKVKILYKKNERNLFKINKKRHGSHIKMENYLSNIPSSWMTDYEIYNDSVEDDNYYSKNTMTTINIKMSSIPCSGCGASLQCKNKDIPGYLPSELFKNNSDFDLKLLTCQRCHFIKYYNMCLKVRVSKEEYPKILKKIQNNKKAIVILIVDLTDFPCSIWPKLPSIIGYNRHIFIVGNKIDLLPIDSSKFSETIKDCLIESLIQTGINKTNIKYIGLISAKTGYGIDQLINKLSKIWIYRSDVYLIGCTNVGKSTLFNILLQSDFCKSQAVDLVQHATTSMWPGTTLNMLKFPILKLSNSRRRCKRAKKLIEERKCNHADAYLRQLELKSTKQIELVSLKGFVSHTFKKNFDLANATKSNFNMLITDTKNQFSLDDKSNQYVSSLWCYDTPGTIQPDQILHLLTSDELRKTLPNKMISPRTFCVWSGQTLFIAGLGRLDILSTSNYIRCTVFASDTLPITICKVETAEHIYNELIQTEALGVPINSLDRIKIWPVLESKNLDVVGTGYYESVSDVLLSNAGWIAISTEKKNNVSMKAWTPEGRGIYLRTPSLLPKSVTLRGSRKIGSPAYNFGQQVHFIKG